MFLPHRDVANQLNSRSSPQLRVRWLPRVALRSRESAGCTSPLLSTSHFELFTCCARTQGFEHPPEVLTRPMQARLHRSDFRRDGLRNLLERELLVLGED